jgi:oxygen tolerance protein BatD
LGPARVKGINVETGGQLYQVPDQQIEVQKEPTGATAPSRGNAPFGGIGDPFEDFFGRRREVPQAVKPKVFLRAVASPSRAFVGQQVTYTVYLYTQGDVNSVNPRALPAFRGFWVRELELPQRLRAEMVEEAGERYGRVALLQRALFPLSPGDVTIEPIDIDLGVRVPEMSAFGPLLSSIEEVRRRTNAVELTIDPLPPAPAGFAGAVGSLGIQAKLDRDQVLAGDAATLTVTLSGEGNLEGLQAPSLDLPDGIKHFPPQKDSSDHSSSTTVGGKRTWSFVLIPQRGGEFRIPSVVVPYFDPGAKTYKQAASPPLTLRSTPLAASAPSPAPAAAPPTTADQEAPRGEGRERGWLRPAAWAAAGGMAMTLLLLGVRSVSRNGAGNRHARRAAESKLRLAAREDRPRQAAAQIEEAWRDFLAARYELSAGTPSPQWPDELARRGVDPQAAEQLKRLADDLHYLRYAPQLASAESLRGEVIERSRRLLRDLR